MEKLRAGSRFRRIAPRHGRANACRTAGLERRETFGVLVKRAARRAAAGNSGKSGSKMHNICG
jgi:hypothetical protein